MLPEQPTPEEEPETTPEEVVVEATPPKRRSRPQRVPVSPLDIESRYQAHLEKVRTGGK